MLNQDKHTRIHIARTRTFVCVRLDLRMRRCVCVVARTRARVCLRGVGVGRAFLSPCM